MNAEILSLASQIESLDDALELWSVLKTKEREMNWLQGDFIALVVDRFGKTKEVYGKLAEVGWGGIKHLQQVERVARSFPDEEERLPDVRWSVYRECHNASTRTGEPPFEILRKALEMNWSIKQIQRYGRPTDEVEFMLAEVCEECGTQYAMRNTSFIQGVVKCPVCALNGIETPLGEFTRKE